MAVTVLERALGILELQRRNFKQSTALRVWVNRHVLPAFEGRMLPVDTNVALRSAALQGPDRRAERDSLIAATARVHGFIGWCTALWCGTRPYRVVHDLTVVACNGSDCAATGVALLDTWRSKA